MSPFDYRVTLLLALMAIISAIDLFRHRGAAIKHREYGFILVTGLLGAAVGVANDLITSSISPDYFILGKGLDEGPEFRSHVAQYGVQVGFSAGVIGGAICLFATRRKSPHPAVPFSILLRALWIPVLSAVIGAGIFPLIFSSFDPARFDSQLNGLLENAQKSKFREVWWIHVGLYAGFAAGLAVMIKKISKTRKRSLTA
jgi:hypothetical protein